MSTIHRIQRRLRKATAAFATLENAAARPDEVQEAWEEFLVHWRAALEMLRKQTERGGDLDLRERRHRERLGDHALNYAWEASNVERHDATGSTETREPGVLMNALDRSQPMIIHHLWQTPGSLSVAASNLVTCPDPGGLEMRAVPGDPRRKVPVEVEPPPGTSPAEIARAALAYASSFLDEVYPAAATRGAA